MHAVVKDSLEEYLSGALEPAGQRDIEAHLSTCEGCREELAGMQNISELFASLQSEEAWPDRVWSQPWSHQAWSDKAVPGAQGFVPALRGSDPRPGFYERVIQQVGGRVAVPSFAGLFSLDLAFARRLVFACLLTLAVLGSYLVVREGEYAGSLSPEAVMAQQNYPAFDSEHGQDNMLVTLAAYDEP
jgi:anti-sigma factor RsiW